MTRILLIVVIVALYILHQDFWFWRTAHPLVFGFVPIGLFYHACFSVAASLVMWLLVKYAWPLFSTSASSPLEKRPVAKKPKIIFSPADHWDRSYFCSRCSEQT